MDLDAAVADGPLVIAKFQTKGCVICRRIEPALKGLAERYADRLRVLEIDAEEEAALGERFGIRAVPTLILFKEGKEAGRCNGFQSASMLRDWIAPYV